MENQKYICVQFVPTGKFYLFFTPPELTVDIGDLVVVNTSRGLKVAKVAQLDAEAREDGPPVVMVDRIATEKDLQAYEENKEKANEAVKTINRFLRENEYGDIKAVDADYTLDASKMTIYMSYEPDVEFDIRSFLKDVSVHFPNTRLDVRQVGPRDVAKMIAGIGACGIEKRCCTRFLKEFSSISIKMAKEQDISLTPSEITGVCGRLRCCLRYEHDTYESLLKTLPKRKKLIQTPLGEGRVTQVLALRESVIVNLPEIGPREFTREELETGVLKEKPIVFEEESDPYHLDSPDVELLNIDKKKPESSERTGRKSKPTYKGRSSSRKREADNKPSHIQRGSSSQEPAKKEEQSKRDRATQKNKNRDNKKFDRKTKFKGSRLTKNTGSDKRE